MTRLDRTPDQWHLDRRFALTLIGAIIIQGLFVGVTAIRFMERVEGEHRVFRETLSELKRRPVAAQNSSVRISILEERYRKIELTLGDIEEKLDLLIAVPNGVPAQRFRRD